MNTKRRSKSNFKFLAIDLFCGAGGATRGLIDAGGYVLAGVDNDESCRKTYTKNNRNRYGDRKYPSFLCYNIFPKTKDYPQGQYKELISKLDVLVDEYRDKYAGLPLLVTCCAPCQPFTKISKAALSESRVEKRARDRNLLSETTKIIRRYKPELIMAENVEGISNSKYGTTWTDFNASLERMQYLSGWTVVCASEFGVPQFRKRTVLLSVRKSTPSAPRIASLFGDEITIPKYDPGERLVSVREAIGHLPRLEAGECHGKIPNHVCRNLSEVNKKRLSAAVPGENNRYMASIGEEDLTLDCHKNGRKKHGHAIFTDVYTRMNPDRPSPTITTRCNSISNGRFGHYDRSQVRAISVREAAMLQSFPEDYVLYPLDQTEVPARLVGNAFPPKMSKFFAQYLIKTISI